MLWRHYVYVCRACRSWSTWIWRGTHCKILERTFRSSESTAPSSPRLTCVTTTGKRSVPVSDSFTVAGCLEVHVLLQRFSLFNLLSFKYWPVSWFRALLIYYRFYCACAFVACLFWSGAFLYVKFHFINLRLYIAGSYTAYVLSIVKSQIVYHLLFLIAYSQRPCAANVHV